MLRALESRIVAASVIAALTLGVSAVASDAHGVKLPPAVELVLWCAAAALAASHRPIGGVALGFGTLILPAVNDRFGMLAAALAAGVARLSAAVLWRLAGRREPPEERPGSEIAVAAIVSLSALAGAAPPASRFLGDSFAGRALSPALVYVSAIIAIVVVGNRVRVGGLLGRWPPATGAGPCS